MTYRITAIFSAVITLSGCTWFGQQEVRQVSDTAASAAITSCSMENPQDKQPAFPATHKLSANLYQSDSENIRLSRLAGERNGGVALDSQFHDENRIAAHYDSKALQTSWRGKPEVTWKSYKFSLNDRWQLGADMPDILNAHSGDGSGSLIPIPRLTYDFGPVKFSSLYFPRVQDYNLNAVMGLYLTVIF
jgi:hypothetical protein